MTTRQEIVDEARSYVGTPFHHQGCAPGVGIDCIGVLRALGKRFDLKGSAELEASRALLAYGPDPDPKLLLECERFMVRITWQDLGLGDVLMMKTLYSRGQPKHFAVVSRLNPIYIIHAWAYVKSAVVENRLDDKLRGRVLACFRFQGVTDG